jgi:hypothetical protein
VRAVVHSHRDVINGLFLHLSRYSDAAQYINHSEAKPDFNTKSGMA